MEHYWRGLQKRFAFELRTRVEYGEGSSSSVGRQAARLGRRAFVVSDRGVAGAGLVDPVMQSLRDEGMAAEAFTDIEANPRLDD